MSHGVKLVEIDENSHDQRLDNFLLKTLKGAPKSLIYRIIRKGEVRVNKGRAKPDTRVFSGDIVRIPPVKLDEKGAAAKPGVSLSNTLAASVLYESDSLLIVNKPSGLAVHGGSGISLGLIEALRACRPEARFLELVHRLDRDTSGCVMVAKKRSMLKYLQDLLRVQGQINKQYVALVQGSWSSRKELVNVPLFKREPKGGERFVEVNHHDGKPSKTRFKLIERFERASLIEARPLTGRTHQIRVHAKHAGHPLIGDDKYGDETQNRKMKAFGIRRLFLHAIKLTIPMPDGTKLEVEAPLSKDLEAGLIALRKVEVG